MSTNNNYTKSMMTVGVILMKKLLMATAMSMAMLTSVGVANVFAFVQSIISREILFHQFSHIVSTLPIRRNSAISP